MSWKALSAPKQLHLSGWTWAGTWSKADRLRQEMHGHNKTWTIRLGESTLAGQGMHACGLGMMLPGAAHNLADHAAYLLGEVLVLSPDLGMGEGRLQAQHLQEHNMYSMCCLQSTMMAGSKAAGKPCPTDCGLHRGVSAGSCAA